MEEIRVTANKGKARLNYIKPLKGDAYFSAMWWPPEGAGIAEPLPCFVAVLIAKNTKENAKACVEKLNTVLHQPVVQNSEGYQKYCAGVVVEVV